MIKIDQLPRPANHVALNCKLVDGCAGTLQSRLLDQSTWNSRLTCIIPLIGWSDTEQSPRLRMISNIAS